MSVIFSRTFRDGEFTAGAPSVEGVLTGTDPSEIGLLGLTAPGPVELRNISERFRVPEHVLESALADGRRIKSERFEDTALLVLRPATYLDAEERVDFGRVVIVVDSTQLVAIAPEEADVNGMLRGLEWIEQAPDLMRFGALGLVHGVFAVTIDTYGPVEDGLEEDIDQIEEQLFGGHQQVSRRIYELFNEVLEFQRATRHLLRMVDDVDLSLHTDAEVPPEMQRRFQRLREQVVHAGDLSDAFRAQLDNALNVNATLVARQQNEDMKRISGWAAILFAPTLVGAIYGMNFRNMPELSWHFGYPLALALMLVLTVGLFTVFKLKKWF